VTDQSEAYVDSRGPDLPSWITVEQRGDGPPGFGWAVVIRGEVATWSKTRQYAELVAQATAGVYYTEIALETKGMLIKSHMLPDDHDDAPQT
jgi:hypothetical protein